MKRILLPTDFSENAYNAINYAMELYKEEQTTFFLMHTYLPPVYHTEYLLHSPSQIGLGDIYQTSSLTQLEQLKDKLEKKFANPRHSFAVHSAFNGLVDEVREVVNSEQIQLIVMGTKGATGAKEILFGSHTVHVIKKVKCPILVIPSGFEFEKPKEILFPTDFEVAYSKSLLSILCEIAEIHLSRIDVLHINRSDDLSEDQMENRNALEQLFSGKTHLFHEVPDNEIIPAINDFQLKNKTNLLVMIQNKHTFLEQLFIKPVIDKISFHLNIPFLVIPYTIT